MKKNLLYIVLSFFTVVANSQNTFEKKLDSIQDETQANKFLETNTSIKGQVFIFNKEKHKTQLAKDLFDIGKGGNKVILTDVGRTHYKIIDKYEIPYDRVSYVFFDGSKKSISEIKELQSKIISKYNEGFRFEDLAKMYSMDANANRGGDLGWITHGDLNPEFETAIINNGHSVNDIFTLDIPEKQAYYVIIKTYPTKLIEEIKVLKVIEVIN